MLDFPTPRCHARPMREKELRLALVCYGGISLAVYMHGITKEVWRLARASRAHQKRTPPEPGSEAVYRRLLDTIAETAGVDLHVIVDILAGASAGGINAIFLAQAVSSGQSLDPLTALWLETADVDRLIDPDSSAWSRFAKSAVVPFAWALSRRGDGAVETTVEPGHQDEVRAKLASFVRGRWFAPPFGGPQFTNLLLDAFEAMAAEPRGASLLPGYQPLDLFVTVTDFRGHPERLRLNTPSEVLENEHRLVIGFRDSGGENRSLADAAELVFAARATASFPGAFPPFQTRELDDVLAARHRAWPGRSRFLQRVLPQQSALGTADDTVLIDGSVLANAPFRPAMAALQSRPAAREVDRRFVYIDPTPDRGAGVGTDADTRPGFFATIFGALSNIPREQPIRDNLDAIDGRSERIRRLRRIVDAMRPRVETAIEEAMGSVFLLGHPTGPRLASWRKRAQNAAAREAGYSYAAYGHLKIAAVTEEAVATLYRLGGGGGRDRLDRIRALVWGHVQGLGLTDAACMTVDGARDDAIDYLRTFDLAFRTRRLRFVARRLAELDVAQNAPRVEIQALRHVVYECIGAYRYTVEAADVAVGDAIRRADVEAAPALAELGAMLDLKRLDDVADARLAEVLVALPKPQRRAVILTYLGFPYYDVATLPMLQGEGLDEFDPVKIDRIAPDDATAIRAGGAAATLKGIQFNNFGAFFSRAYRENDYLWGRLHGAERLIDITVSTLPAGIDLPAETVAGLKRDIFRAILDEERCRLTAIAPLFDELGREIG